MPRKLQPALLRTWQTGLLAAALAACTGGQTGLEGVPCPDPTVTADDVNSLLTRSGDHTMAYRTELQSEPAVYPVSLDLMPFGTPDPDCGGLLQNLTLRLQAGEGATAEMNATATLYHPGFAEVRAEVPGTLLGDLEPALAPELRDHPWALTLAVAPEGVFGQAWPQSPGRCALAVVPADNPCPLFHVPIDVDDEVYGFRPRTALERLQTEQLPLTWADGRETTLTIEVDRAPIHACMRGTHAAQPFQQRVIVGLQVHVQSADGSLDTRVPGELALDITDRERTHSRVVAAQEGYFALVVQALVPAPTTQGLHFAALSNMPAAFDMHVAMRGQLTPVVDLTVGAYTERERPRSASPVARRTLGGGTCLPLPRTVAQANSAR